MVFVVFLVTGGKNWFRQDESDIAGLLFMLFMMVEIGESKNPLDCVVSMVDELGVVTGGAWCVVAGPNTSEASAVIRARRSR